jgi:copper chaperone
MIRLKVTGMTCQHCEKAVSEALSGVSGVAKVVAVSHRRDEAVVEGAPDLAALIAAVREEGYDAEAAP